MSDSGGGGVRHIRIGGHLDGEDELYNLFVPSHSLPQTNSKGVPEIYCAHLNHTI